MAPTTLRPKTLAYALSALAFASPVACKHGGGATGETRNVDLSQVVAKVDDEVITVGDVQERINKQSPFIRARYTTLDKKKEFLDNLVRFEVMAAEAQKRGYDKDPEVQRVMKQQMISKFLQKDFESKLKVEDVPDADVEKYYNDAPRGVQPEGRGARERDPAQGQGQGRQAPTPRRARCPRRRPAPIRRGSAIWWRSTRRTRTRSRAAAT